MRIARKFLPFVDFAHNLYVPPETAGFAKTGTVDRALSSHGIGYQSSGASYYDRSIALDAQPKWLLSVYVESGQSTNAYTYGISNFVSSGAFVGLRRSTSLTVDGRYRASTSAATCAVTGPVIEMGAFCSAVWAPVSTIAALNYLYVNGAIYQAATDTSGTSTFDMEGVGVLRITSGQTQNNNNILMVARGSRELPSNLARDLSINPWQLWEARRRYWSFVPSAQPTAITHDAAIVEAATAASLQSISILLAADLTEALTASDSSSVTGSFSVDHTAAATATETESAELSLAVAQTEAVTSTATASAVLLRSIRAVLDVNDGLWTASSGTDLSAMVNEAEANDGTYIKSPTNPTGNACDLEFSDPGFLPDLTQTGALFRYRAGSAEGGLSLQASLYCDTTLIKSWTVPSLPAGFEDYEEPLSPAELANITNVNALHLELTADA